MASVVICRTPSISATDSNPGNWLRNFAVWPFAGIVSVEVLRKVPARSDRFTVGVTATAAVCEVGERQGLVDRRSTEVDDRQSRY